MGVKIFIGLIIKVFKMSYFIIMKKRYLLKGYVVKKEEIW